MCAQIHFLLVALFSFELATGKVHLAFESSELSFICKTAVTPIWMEKTKSIIMANGLDRRATFKDDRLECLLKFMPGCAFTHISQN